MVQGIHEIGAPLYSKYMYRASKVLNVGVHQFQVHPAPFKPTLYHLKPIVHQNELGGTILKTSGGHIYFIISHKAR